MPTSTQLQNIWLLSDTVLYPEAVAFMRRLVQEQQCRPLPTSQVKGLFNISAALQYEQLSGFIVHQRSRNWPGRQSDIKIFYLALEETLENMQKRLRGDFHLIAGGRKAGPQGNQEEYELMALLAREFIQHLIAENGLLASKAENERRPPARNYQQTQSSQRLPQTNQPGQHRANRG